MKDDFITKKKAHILYRYMSCVIKCPHCGEELIFDMTENLGASIIDVICPDCKELSTIDTFHYLSQNN
jgi:ribosomal protein S27E